MSARFAWRCDISHSYMCRVCRDSFGCVPFCRDQFVCVPWLVCLCTMNYSWVWWLVHICNMTYSYVQHDSFNVRHDSSIYVLWLIKIYAVPHSFMWHDSFIGVTWLIHACDMTRSYTCCDSFIFVAWRIHTCGTTWASRIRSCATWLIHMSQAEPYLWHDWFICVTWPFIWVTWLMRDVFVRLRHAHSYMSQVEPRLWHDSIICVTSPTYDLFVRVWHLCVTYLYVCDTYVGYICMCVTWLVPHVRHAELASWLVYMSQAEPCLWHDSIICITSMTQSYVSHPLCATICMCVTWLVHAIRS